MIIKLSEDYYIEVDEWNYTLKQKYIGKDKKTNEPKEAEKIHGFFSTFEGAVRKYLKLNQIALLSQEAIEMNEYIKSIERINEGAVKAFKSIYNETVVQR